MAARVYALLPKLTALTLIWLLATSTITFAAGGRPAVNRPAPAPAAPKGQQTLIVPDVRRQAYVFAKGILEDGGFAWRVQGPIGGYAANLVASQQPAPGTKVVDNGAPTIVLSLERNPGYAEQGVPENASPYAGTKVVLAKRPAKAKAPAPSPAPAPAPAAPETKRDKQPAKAKAKAPKSAQKSPKDDARKAAFHVPGAPAEPLDEMPLPDRARLLERRLAGSAEPRPELVQYWLYQHSWIVTGAKFGWSGGAEALRTLVAVDRDLQARWGIGAKSAAVARAALAEVERRSRS